MITSEVIDKKSNWLKLVDTTKMMNKSHVDVGFQDDGKTEEKSDVKVVDVAIYNEFGTGRIPSRPFMRMYFDKNNEKIAKACNGLLKDVVSNKKSNPQALGLLGEFCKKGIIKQIDESNDYDPNAESTINRKGSSKPLIDTGIMRESVTYKIVIKGLR